MEPKAGSKSKRIFWLPFCLFFIFLLCAPHIQAQDIKTFRNPAAVYCKAMGYQYELRKDQRGNVYGVCIFPDQSECDAWDFYKGKVKKSFSYCAKKGFDTKSIKTYQLTYSTECAICVSKDKKTEITVLEFMKRDNVPLKFEGRHSRPDIVRIPTADTMELKEDLPVEFDWRNVEGHTYIGPVRNQGDCGSCYAFGAAAAAEGTYNFATNTYDAGCADFSESFIIWCLGRLPQYGSHFYGCNGADYEYAELDAIVNVGIGRESYFPYTISDPGSCTHWEDPTVSFSSWGRIGWGNIDGIKTALCTYGVLDAAVYVTGDFSDYSGGIFRDNNNTCPSGAYTTTNHAVTLVGWGNDPIYGDYWILRNSWGSSWGEGGYMRIEVNSAAVACAATYLTYSPGPPNADFEADPTTACANSMVQLTDLSTGGPSAWQWTIAPAAVTYMNDTNRNSRNPQVRFNQPGTFTVTLAVSNAYGSDSMTKPDYITVIDGCALRLDLLTDYYGGETTWELRDSLGAVLYSGGPYQDATNYTIDMCLEEGSYTFTIYDAWGDGICCSNGIGSYTLTDVSNNLVIVTGGEFGDEESTNFNLNNCGPADAFPWMLFLPAIIRK